MVELYSVIHGMQLSHPIHGTVHAAMSPSRGLVERLARLPAGSRIGIETLDERAWQRIEDHLRAVADREGAEVCFPDMSQDYWRDLEHVCQQLDFETVCLDDEQVWMRTVEAFVTQAKVIGAQNRSVESGGFVADCEQNETLYSSEVAARVLHEIERDTGILATVARNELAAAVVGGGHGDWWYANREELAQAGVLFSSYAREEPVKGDPTMTALIPNAIPDPKLVYGRTSLERAQKILEQGRVTERTPDFVGTWDLATPSRGYFELFVEHEEGPRFHGTTEDILGMGSCTGRITDEEVRFVKTYVESTYGAAEGEIQFRAQAVTGGLSGHFDVDGFGVAFFMTQAERARPMELTRRWYETSA